MTAREAVQTAEDARAIAVKRQEENALAAERQQSVEREARAENARAAAQIRDRSRQPRSRSGANQGAGGCGTPDAREGCAGGGRLAEADRVKRENDAARSGSRRARSGSPEDWKTKRAQRPPRARRTV